jgi:hypothetical protein
MTLAADLYEKFHGASRTTIFVAIFVAIIVYAIYLAIQRLYFSPLAKFPGPRLAALSRWYEFYYEVVLRGQYSFHIKELHKKYGEITSL